MFWCGRRDVDGCLFDSLRPVRLAALQRHLSRRGLAPVVAEVIHGHTVDDIAGSAATGKSRRGDVAFYQFRGIRANVDRIDVNIAVTIAPLAGDSVFLPDDAGAKRTQTGSAYGRSALVHRVV